MIALIAESSTQRALWMYAFDRPSLHLHTLDDSDELRQKADRTMNVVEAGEFAERHPLRPSLLKEMLPSRKLDDGNPAYTGPTATFQNTSWWTARMERYYSPRMPPPRSTKKVAISSKRLERLAAQDPDLAILRIGKVSEYTGLSASGIRKYETLGLLLPRLTGSGQRLFSQRDVAWIRQLQAFQDHNHLGPLAVRYLLRLIPNQQVRRHFLNKDCTYSMGSEICWQSAEGVAQMRQVCRACPVYLRKDIALDISRYFTMHIHGDSG